jgi:sterol desaturase/sphingolipid hydroxylase (fatty acid hydroxylase superfamily)
MNQNTPDPTSYITAKPTCFGSGWISGIASAVLGAIGLSAVSCFRFPSVFTVPEMRSLYPIPYIRALLHIVLVCSFILGVINVCLKHHKILGMTGIAFTLIATMLGGSRVQIPGDLAEGPFLGLDWFLLNLIVFSAVFIPLERLFAHRPEQPIFRYQWRTDLIYFCFSALFIQVTTVLTIKPAMVFFHWARHPGLQAWIAGLPFVVQFIAILFLTDFVQYWVHRAFHEIPVLWRFHAIHHSAENMDWVAGSRLHLVDIAVTRGLTYVPIYLLGFHEAPLYTYIAFLSFQTTLIHANVQFEFGPLRWLIATPQFHHWHHAAEKEAIDKNFAVHLPLLDWLFGTFHMPKGRWPASYGIGSGHEVPNDYLSQFVHPFLPKQKDTAAENDRK